MHKKIFTFLMTLCLLATYMPSIVFTSYAEGEQKVYFDIDDITSLMVEYNGQSSTVENGDFIEASPGTTIKINGVSGYYLTAAFGKTMSEAESNTNVVQSSEKGGSVNISTQSSYTGAKCYIYVSASTQETEAVLFHLSGLSSTTMNIAGETKTVSNGETLQLVPGTKLVISGVSGKWITAQYKSPQSVYSETSSNAGGNIAISTDKGNTSNSCTIKITLSDTDPDADDPDTPVEPEPDPSDPDDPSGGDDPSEDDWENWGSEPGDEDVDWDWDENPSPDDMDAATYGLLVGRNIKMGSSKFTVEVVDEDGNKTGRKLVGPCTWDGVPAATKGKTYGWIREVVGSKDDPKFIAGVAEYNKSYAKLYKTMYYGVYKGKANTKKKWIQLHLACCVWANKVDDPESSHYGQYSKFARNKKTAKAAISAVTSAYLKKKDVPANEGFKIYRWYPAKKTPFGEDIDKYAAKRQIALVCEANPWGYVQIQKKQTNTSSGIKYATECPNNYTLKGAKYHLYNEDGTDATDAYGNVLGDIEINTADANYGYSDIICVSPGTYYAIEVTASKGHKVDADSAGNKIKRYQTVSTSNTAGNPAIITSEEPPTYNNPNIKTYKIDTTSKYGAQQLVGALYTVKYYDVTEKSQIAFATPKRQWTFETSLKNDTKPGVYYAGFDWQTDPVANVDGNSAFYIENGVRILPCGWFTIEEVEAPSGLARNDEIHYGRIYQTSNGSDAVTEIEGANSEGELIIHVKLDESPTGINIVIDKKNAQTGENAATESAENHSSTRKARFSTLAGATYNVYYKDSNLPYYQIVGTMITDKNGHAELSKREKGDPRYLNNMLLPGQYLIEEISPAPGFVIDEYQLADGVQEIAPDKQITVVIDYDEDGNPVTKNIKGTFNSDDLTYIDEWTSYNHYTTKTSTQTGKHLFETQPETLNTAIFTYTAESTDYGAEVHIKKTDATTSKEVEGAKLQVVSLESEDFGTVVEEWTSGKEEHIIRELPTGKYLLREITAPYGYDIAEDVEFEVKENTIVTKVEMKNKPLEIGTTALDKETNSHQGVFSETETIVDKVNLSGLYKGRTYKVVGKLVDKATGNPLTNAEGEVITAETEPFVATGDEHETEVTFTINSSAFDKDKVVVAFERLWRLSPVEVKEGHPARDDDSPIELTKHEDLKDEAQSIHYGGVVKTIATDANSKTHNILGDKDVVITDVVEYKNLSTESTYTLEGELYDKTTGQRTGIVATTPFKPQTNNGTAIVTFKFDATQLQNHALVVFETLKINTVIIDKHEDPNDEEQTVYVPKIATKIGKKDGKYVKDVVYYENLIPGQKYVIRGHFVRKSNGKKVKFSDGKLEFTPTTASGSVEVKLNPRNASGKLVAVESCYIINPEGKEVLVGRHADINDKAQTYTAKKPKTGDNVTIFWIGGAFVLAISAYFIYRKKKH